MFTSLLLLSQLAVAAEPCDAKALIAAVQEAAPVAVGNPFVKLAACNPAEAQKLAPAVMDRMIVGDYSRDALLAAVKLRAFDVARAWVSKQQSDVKTRVIGHLGDACADTPAVGEFFLEAFARDPDRFWQERWHKGLASCRTPDVQKMLTESLSSKQVGKDSRNAAGFLSLLEVYARNLRGAAIPTLTEVLRNAKDESFATPLLVVFADVANIGGAGGTDAAAAAAAVKAIVEAAPSIPERTVERARGTLIALGDEAAANALAKHRFRDRYVDGRYTWGIAAVEQFVCKNAEERAVLHIGTLSEPGNTWPDAMGAMADAAARASWKLDGAAKCKGTGTVTVEVSPEPLSAEGVAAWVKEKKSAFSEANGSKKLTVIDEVALSR
jgi:hypothetical protein